MTLKRDKIREGIEHIIEEGLWSCDATQKIIKYLHDNDVVIKVNEDYESLLED